jgi:Flp pilus assembly protein TadD
VGELHYYVGNTDLARKELQAAIALSPNLINAWLSLAAVYDVAGEPGKAREILYDVTKKWTMCFEPAVQLATAYCKERNLGKAAEIVRSAHLMATDDPVLKNNLAALYLERGTELNEALQLAQEAYELMPDDPAIADTLGWAYYKKSVFRQAVWYLQEAEKLILNGVSVDFDPFIEAFVNERNEHLKLVRFHLGMALIKSGKIKAGKAKLSAAMALGLDGLVFKMAEQALTEGNASKLQP